MNASTKGDEGKAVVLDFNEVSFSYGEIPVLDRVSFHAHQGEFIALVGPNGSGKTTLIKLVLGLESPTSGAVTLLGETPSAARRRVGYVPQHANFDPAFPISVREVVRMGRLVPGSSRARAPAFHAAENAAINSALERSGVAGLALRPYSALSGGQRRRVLVARALAAEPEFLILDEPTANMDAESETRLFETLGAIKGATTIMIVTHDTGFVSALTDVVLCVGERGTDGSSCALARHATRPIEGAPPVMFGGNAAQVLHDSNLADSCANCGKKGAGE
jgi:zinc transport system ATP-binding protein